MSKMKMKPGVEGGNKYIKLKERNDQIKWYSLSEHWGFGKK